MKQYQELILSSLWSKKGRLPGGSDIFLLGIITRGKFLQVHVVGFGQEEERKLMGKMILCIRTTLTMWEGASVRCLVTRAAPQSRGSVGCGRRARMMGRRLAVDCSLSSWFLHVDAICILMTPQPLLR